MIKDIKTVLQEASIPMDEIITAALELWVPHPGVETKEKATNVFQKEMDLALSDPNIAILIFAGLLLEKEGAGGNIPQLSQADYDADLTFLIADEVIGMSIAKYIGGYKGTFEYVRYDKAKPGILSRLGPFMDDVIGGLIGGVSANMYTRAGFS